MKSLFASTPSHQRKFWTPAKATRGLIVYLVRQQPGITTLELAEGLGYSKPKNVAVHLRALQKDGKIIYRTEGDYFRRYYLTHSNTSGKAVPTPVTPPKPFIDWAKSTLKSDAITVEHQAKEFHWQTGSNDLKEFVKWCQE